MKQPKLNCLGNHEMANDTIVYEFMIKGEIKRTKKNLRENRPSVCVCVGVFLL